jgi:Domain of unknown function (DUF4375)
VWSVFASLVAKELSSLSPWERRLVAFGYLRQEVNSGGFSGYLFNGYAELAGEAIAAAESVGLHELAVLTRRALSFIDGADPSDVDACQEALDALDDDAGLVALDTEFYALEQRADLDESMRALLPDGAR